MVRPVLWVDDEALGGLEPLAVKASLVEDFRLQIATSASQAEQLLASNEFGALVFDICLESGWAPLQSRQGSDRSGLQLLKRYLSAEFAMNGAWRKVPVSRIGVMTVVMDPETHREIMELGVSTVVVKSTHMESDALLKMIRTLLAHDPQRSAKA